MNTLISGITGSLYRHVAKPILFKFKPDNVHERMVNMSYKLRRRKIILNLIRSSLRFENKSLEQTFHGIKFVNPIGLTAGVDKNGEMPAVCEAVGFGMIEVGTTTISACSGNPRPWFHRLPKTKSLMVYAGLANDGISAINDRLQKYDKRVWERLTLNISVGKTNCEANADDEKGIADNVAGINAVLSHGMAKLITINISCPNTFGGEPFTDAKRLKQLLDAVAKLKPKIPFSIKMPIDKSWADFRKLLEVLDKYEFVKFITIGNLAKDRSKIIFKDELPRNAKGNFSGLPTRELSNNLIRNTYINYGERFTIIGVGGIFTPDDAVSKIRLGASLVEVATGLIFNGPQLIGQINRYISKELSSCGKTIHDIIGIDA